jgi:hypothetical protein
MRRLPRQGARHSTVDHGDASDGVFLLLYLWVLPSSCAFLLQRSPSSLSLSLACGWPLDTNGFLSSEWRHLHELRVEGPSGAKKGGANRPPKWPRPAGLGRPAQAHPSPVRSPLRSRGSSCNYALHPLHLHYFDDVTLASKMNVLHAWSPVFYASILGDVPL